MRLPLLTVVLASLLPIPCQAICAVEPIEPQITEAVLVITSETGEVRFGFCDYMQSLHVDGRKIAPVGNPL